MNAKGYIVVVVIAVALGAWLWMKPAAAPAMPEGSMEEAARAETMPAVETNELNALDIQDADFADIDVDAQAL